MTLTARELATVLFALRHAQLLVESPSDREGLREQGHFTDLEPLSVEEIDDLCDRLNAKEEDDSARTVYVLSEHEPNHEYPCVILGVYATAEGAGQLKTVKQTEKYGVAEDPEGYDFKECDLWWEVDEHAVRS